MCGLQGSIPEEVGNMTSFTRLYLSDNNLTRTIPITFKNLHNLEVLDLYENEINGPVAVLLESLPTENKLQEFWCLKTISVGTCQISWDILEI